ncbi:hypothetical protein DL764_010264 [Monosporascus ibericus]|uniref:Uncharacterized protein n=1 Tax=Monosporascus ibericus TaxID=155417 RepID=A0A4Q4ST08_9PEZI|nr:hypothetical protein DL764_010264 [Monosporascus ibericus]
MNEAISRLQRLRQQQKFLRTKNVEMINRSLQSLDELEEQEKAKVEAAAQAVQAAGVSDLSGPEAANWSFPADPGWKAILNAAGFANKSSSTGAGHS